ncbi:mechanosensitive ion channel family protein [Gilvimarinus sp. 1_MG-2023]|uniref:mechanosensitive ion channel family protein n=1 Tax=Gilvimarinus sp. 1_MG-2023 TaxID=3062638 RepID=UPI0026E490EB|nr:mechanosensitive ion channel family protein [Gilvimarinus sp. 1_MG-2023]MDO6746641.1 mechanosensitive ion channel family protein [Gilvimarinus sp. 1_MG-2023]
MPICRYLIAIILLGCFNVGFSQTALDLLSTSESSAQSSSASSACQGDSCSPNESSESNEPALSLHLDQVIDVNEIAISWEAQINSWLEALGFSASWAAKGVATAIVLIITGVVIMLVAAGSKKIYKKVISNDHKLRFNRKRLKLYRRVLSAMIHVVVVLLCALTLFVIWWGGDAELVLADTITGWLAQAVNFSLAFVVLLIVFELVSAAIESYFHRLAIKDSARINTLIPIVRNIIYGVMILLFAITLISEMGVNVTPILASAGVIGIAVGFAAQALIKDVLNGFIIVLEDLVNVGDVITVGERTGIVEKITLRKIQLRDLDGCVYTVPCSEITVVKNFTKIFSYYLFDIGVAYRENTDEVCAVLNDISSELIADDYYSQYILEPLEILGVNAFADSAVMIKARIKTKPIHQWEVGREFNRRMKYAFDKRNIEIPFPHQTLYFGENKQGEATSAKFTIDHATQGSHGAEDQQGSPRQAPEE